MEVPEGTTTNKFLGDRNMNPLKNKSTILVTAWAILAVFSACSNDDPAVIFDPNATGALTPEITAVDPSDSAVAGVTKVKITGKNFSPAVGKNFVYFGTAPAVVLEASSTELTVVPPVVVANSLAIRVVVDEAFVPATYARPYALRPITIPYGRFGTLNSITMDSQENLYASPPSAVIKLSPNGQATPYSTLIFPAVSAMKIGPGGALYVQRNNNIRLYQIAPTGGDAQEFVRFPIAVSFFDFDQNGNIFAGGNNGLFVMNPNRTIKTVGQYQNIPIRTLRVFSGYVYVGVAGTSPGIWKNQILNATGDLGNNELVFNWTNAGEFAASAISDLTFAEDGDMYVAAERKTPDPILVVHPNQTTEVLYKGVLKYQVSNFVWGADQFLYVNHENASGVSRIAMGKNGAPYFGRR